MLLHSRANGNMTTVMSFNISATMYGRAANTWNTHHTKTTLQKIQSYTDDLVTPLKATYWCKKTVVLVRPVRCLLLDHNNTRCQLVNKQIWFKKKKSHVLKEGWHCFSKFTVASRSRVTIPTPSEKCWFPVNMSTKAQWLTFLLGLHVHGRWIQAYWHNEADLRLQGLKECRANCLWN